MSPKPAVDKRRASGDDKAPAKKSQAKVEKTDCPGCLYLKRYYPDVPLVALRPHCGQHPVDPETLKSDGLPPPAPPPPPEQLPEDYLPFIDRWDGKLRTIWATTATMFPPESSSWEHLIAWSQQAREEFPKLTVHALCLMLQRLLPDDPEASRRLRLIHKDEIQAERMTWKKLAEPVRPPDDKTEKVVRPKEPDSPKPEGKTAVTDKDKKEAVSKPASSQKAEEGRDKFGYKLGTRAAKINACLMDHPNVWYTAQEVEATTGTTSAGSHLSSLASGGWVEYAKAPPGERGGKYRLKKK